MDKRHMLRLETVLISPTSNNNSILNSDHVCVLCVHEGEMMGGDGNHMRIEYFP